MKYSIKDDIRIAEVPVKDFRILLYDGVKKSMGKNRCNAGFFGAYSEKGQWFTLPSAHLVADYEASSKWTRKYCEERGEFNGDKFTFDASKWRYANEFYYKAISTLIVKNGEARIEDICTVPDCNYAISGVPIIRGGKDVKFDSYVTGQGWVSGNVRATWNVFVGLKKNDDNIYVMAMKTTTGNMVKSGEAFRKFWALGFHDVIKMDGGGSFYFNANGTAISTAENRRVCSIFDFGHVEGNPYSVPTTVLFRGAKNSEAVKWLQWELRNRGYRINVDGSFGPATLSALKAYQKVNGLEPDGYCGPATRASLTK